MSEAMNVTIFGVGADSKTLGLEVDELGHYPEQRLWCAVIIATVDEYREWCARIENTWILQQRPVARAFHLALAHVRRECQNKWFQAICDMADWSADKVLAKFDELDREYGIKHIPADTEGPVFLSEYQLARRAKKLRKYIN